MDESFAKEVADALWADAHAGISEADAAQLTRAVSRAAMNRIYDRWQRTPAGRRISYFSAEYLTGRLLFNNLLNMRLLDEAQALLRESGVDLHLLEQIEDPPLGSGGLGRLAACFLDAAATQGLALDGYGIRYTHGMFRQTLENGFQKEMPVKESVDGDGWLVRREQERVPVSVGGQTVWAVPYDMPVIGYGMRTVNTLRLWQSEAVEPFDLAAFNQQKYAAAFARRDAAELVTAVLYPNDDGPAGKRLRLTQQYFVVSASLQDLLRRFKRNGGVRVSDFPAFCAIQLNDTYTAVGIPELIRLLTDGEGMKFSEALAVARQVFAYTNHTLMPEALESWDVRLFRRVLPQVYPVVRRLQQALRRELQATPQQSGVQNFSPFDIIADDRIHMARLAVFASHAVNGVSELHTELLKTRVLPDWYARYPERFHSITNGISQRRWLALANPELSALITEAIGGQWITHLDELTKLEAYAHDRAFLEQLRFIRQRRKKQLAAYLERRNGLMLRWDFLLDVQVKRIHEYKRQLLNAFSILDRYFGIKEGRLSGIAPTAFLFGGKAAPGYYRAKAVIKFIHEIAQRIAADPEVSGQMQVLFVPDYSVSYAEKIIPATDISEQISTAGTEASGTGNMKFMLNGALTLGTWDGANIEIAERAGRENNYFFGATEEEIARTRPHYRPREILDANPRLRRVVDTLVDGTFHDGGTGMFADLYRSLTEDSWLPADYYYLFGDFDAYSDVRLRAGREYADSDTFWRKSLVNIAHAGFFSADRAVLQYAYQIWGL